MSKNFHNKNDADLPVANIPIPITEEPTANFSVERDESIASKTTNESLDETVDSQTSDTTGTTPGTPESSKDISDKSSPVINTYRTVKPVLGKIQAKKRLMAFANKYNVIPKVQKVKPVKPPVPSKSITSESAKNKEKSTNNVKMLIDELNSAKSKIEAALNIQEKQEQYSSPQTSKNDKIFAIEEIIREESRMKMMERGSPRGLSHHVRQSSYVSQEENSSTSIKSHLSDRSATDTNRYPDNRGRPRLHDNSSQQSRNFENRRTTDYSSFRRHRSRSRERPEENKFPENRDKRDGRGMDRNQQKLQEKERCNRDRDEKRDGKADKNRSRGRDEKRDSKRDGRVQDERRTSKDDNRARETSREHKIQETSRESRIESKVPEESRESNIVWSIPDEKKGTTIDNRAVEEKNVIDEIKVPEERRETQDESRVEEENIENRGESRFREAKREIASESKAKDEKMELEVEHEVGEKKRENKDEDKIEDDKAEKKIDAKVVHEERKNKDEKRKSRSNSRVKEGQRKSRSNSRAKEKKRKSRSNSRAKEEKRKRRSNSIIKDDKKKRLSDGRMRDEGKEGRENREKSLESKSIDKKENEYSSKYNSWVTLKHTGISSTIYDTRADLGTLIDGSNMAAKSRTVQDYTKHFEQMMMLGDHKLMRNPVIAAGLEGPKYYPPESMRATKNVKGTSLLYCENPRVSLLLTREQVFQAIPNERRKTMREICETTGDYDESVQLEDSHKQRNWYRRHEEKRRPEKSRRSSTSTSHRFPKSKWDSEDDYPVPQTDLEAPRLQEKIKPTVNPQSSKKINKRIPTTVPSIDEEEEIETLEESEQVESQEADKTKRPIVGETLVSEYEQFMKMVSSDLPISSPPKVAEQISKPESPIDATSTIRLEFDFGRDPIKRADSYKTPIDQEILGRQRRSSRKKTSKDRRVSEAHRVEKEHRTMDDSTVPADWKNVVIKVERTSDDENQMTKLRAKKRTEKIEKRSSSSDSSESSSSSSSSESETERARKKRRRKRRKRKRGKKRKMLKDSSSNTESSSSSEDTSSDEKSSKRKRRRNGKRKNRGKRSRVRKKRARRASTESDTSSTSVEEIKSKRRRRRGRAAKRRRTSDSIVSLTVDDKNPEETIERMKILPEHKIKIETTKESRKETRESKDKIIEPLTTWKKTESSEISQNNEQDPSKENREDLEENRKICERERFLEEWENDLIPLPPKIIESPDSKGSSSRALDDTLQKCEKKSSKIGKSSPRRKSIDASEKRNKSGKSRNSRNDEIITAQQNETRNEIDDEKILKKVKKTRLKKKSRNRSSSTSSTSSSSSESSSDASTTSSASKSSRNEFIDDWETKKDNQEANESLRKIDTKEHGKWPITDFDSLNVPSLTQLEKVTGKTTTTLANEWEVDSMDENHESNSCINEKTTKIGSSKKIAKEVRYDRETDTYIAVEREEMSKENRKSQVRHCAIRIWEEEEEEEERDELRRRKEREKIAPVPKIKGWESDDECFTNNPAKVSTEIPVQLATITRDSKNTKDSIDTEAKSPPQEEISVGKINVDDTPKKNRKSRWDISAQTPDSTSEEKIIPVMWEEEETIGKWPKIVDTKNETGNLIDENLSKIKMEKIIEVPKIEMLKRPWSPENVQTPQILKKPFDGSSAARERDWALYSPSSPGLSVKSEDTSTNSSTSSNEIAKISGDKVGKLPITNVISTENLLALDKITELKIGQMIDKKNEKENMMKPAMENWSAIVEPKEKEQSDDDSYNSGESSVMRKLRMDMFAEYAIDETEKKVDNAKISYEIDGNDTKDGPNDAKLALKLIPKQLLIRKPIDDVKSTKSIVGKISEVVNKHNLVRTQEITRESKIADSMTEEKASIDETSSENLRSTTPPLLSAQRAKIYPVSEEIIGKKSSPSHSSKSNSPRLVHSTIVKEANEEQTSLESRQMLEKERATKSPSSERRKKSPVRREKDKWKPIGGDERASGSNYRGGSYGSVKDGIERRRDDERENRGFRRRSSPARSRSGRKSRTPTGSGWERKRSRSPSKNRSWSRSRSKSPRRRDEGSNWEREKRGARFNDDRRDRFSRSPSRHATGGSTKNNKRGPPFDKWDRDRGRRNYDDDERRDRDRSRDRTSSYDPLEMLRDADRANRAAKFRSPETTEKPAWRFDDNKSRRESSERLDMMYANGQGPSLDYEERTYSRDASLEREINEGPIRSLPPRDRYTRGRNDDRRDSAWNRSRSPESDRYEARSFRRGGRKISHSRGRRCSRSPINRGRFDSRSRSRSRSRSWTRSRTRSRTRTRSRSRSRSRSRRRSFDRSRRSLDRGRRSRTITPTRDRVRDDDSRKRHRRRSTSRERGRRIETIVQSSAGLSSGNATGMDSDLLLGEQSDVNSLEFRYANENQTSGDYDYYPRNNLTYPPRVDENTGSPKRLSLDDRLELELGIKKQLRQEPSSIATPFNPPAFNARSYPPSSITSGGPAMIIPPGQRNIPGIYNRQQPTVLQVGNVLQVVPVPGNFSNISSPGIRPNLPSLSSTATVTSAANRVVRVGNVLQVVPTPTIDWPGTSSTAGTERRSGAAPYSTSIPASSPASLPMTAPVPVPVPLPVPVPVQSIGTPSSSTMSPAPLGLPIPPVALPVPASVATTASPFATRPERPPRPPPPPPVAQPVYNYEAILEVRRKEREERKKLREERRREKERRKSERVRRRAKRLLGRNGSEINRLVADSATSEETEEINKPEEEIPSVPVDATSVATTDETKEKSQVPSVVRPNVEETTAEPEDEEEEDEDEEGDVEEDEEEEEEEEEEPEEEADEDGQAAVTNNQEIQDKIDTPVVEAEADIKETEVTSNEPFSLPPPPRKGILVPPGFWEDTISNGNANDLSGPEDNETVDQEERPVIASLEDEEQVAMGDDEDERADNESENDKDTEGRERLATTPKRSSDRWSWSTVARATKKRRNKKAVQFADGVRPGEGTSPSGGEGDMPSPPPPVPALSNDSIRDIVKRSRSRKSRKKPKRAKPPKTKKKVKVKIIKLKKPRITPLTAMMLDDSDDLDDRSPPPPPPGSPPPPHLWPSYLAAYNATLRTVENSSSPPPPVAAPPPPTPLPLLVPPPPLNYTIQPCSKA